MQPQPQYNMTHAAAAAHQTTKYEIQLNFYYYYFPNVAYYRVATLSSNSFPHFHIGVY